MSDSGEPAEQMTISAAEIQQPTSAPVDNADEQPAVEKSADSESADVPASAAQPNRASLAAFVGEFESSAAASPPTGSKRKRSRRNTMEAKASAPENNNDNNDDEDINLHVEADWSDDEKDDKEPSSKRAVAEADNGAPSAAKKPMPSALEDFTIRAVVTRKDVDVIFEHREGAKEKLERDTDTRIGIVAGTDDPDIVVDRVLVIKGPIDGVAMAYKIITEGMLAIKLSKAAASAADTSAPAAKQKQSDKDGMHDEDASDDEGDDSKQAAAGPADAEAAGSDADEAGSPRASGADSDNDGPDDDDHTNNTAIREGVAKPAATGESKPADDANKAEKPAVASDAPASASTASSDEKKGRTSQSSSADHITLRMLVPQKCVGSIMGHGGRSINRIRDEASVNIHTSEDTLPRSSERIVAVVGTPSAIQKSIVLMATALTRDIVSYNNAELYVPAANLPSAMTVETNHRKRRDAKRQNQGYNDHYSGNRNYSNRSSGYRQNGGSSHGSGYRNNNYGSSGGGNRNYGHASNGNSGYGRSNMHGSNRNDRYSRSSNDRQSNRGRTPGTISHVNRMPVGASTNTPSHHGNSNNSNYRSGGHGSGNRTASSPNAANYGGYPAPSPTFYQSYRPHASGPANMGGGGNGAGGMTGMRYGTAMSPVSPGQNSGVYGGGFATAPVPYQFASPVGYAYPAAPVQGMYGGPAAQPSQPYPSRGGRPMMSQGQYSHPQQPPPQQQQQQQPRYDGQYQRQPMLSPSLGMGAAPPSGPSASGYAPGAVDQTIQKIYVSADKVGAVIGHRGETINNIRQSTNARVDIQDPAHGSQERLIIITGGYEQVHSAFSMIKNKIATTRPSGMRP
ncbi:PAB1 binding protein [Coemansia interrupta]|uniref:PAB1 binding protein n=1 Tax=Coemansia interrupta TaxID=1126814 RepID=A0A9W8HJ40_9FUNG|nr:PAB1 binding protein [Coemansia interrupta]